MVTVWNYRKRFHEIMDDLDQFMESAEEEIEDVIRQYCEADQKAPSKPIVYGFSVELGANGVPVIRTFGDRGIKEGFREPISDQVIDEQRGQLKIIAELPGVDRNEIEARSTETETALTASKGELSYKATIQHRAPVHPETASATYINGILEIAFRLKDKANKGYTTVKIG